MRTLMRTLMRMLMGIPMHKAASSNTAHFLHFPQIKEENQKKQVDSILANQ
jgi:hypothetical protein